VPQGAWIKSNRSEWNPINCFDLESRSRLTHNNNNWFVANQVNSYNLMPWIESFHISQDLPPICVCVCVCYFLFFLCVCVCVLCVCVCVLIVCVCVCVWLCVCVCVYFLSFPSRKKHFPHTQCDSVTVFHGAYECLFVCDFLSLSFVPAGECNGSCHVALLQLLLMPLPLLFRGAEASGIGIRARHRLKEKTSVQRPHTWLVRSATSRLSIVSST